MQKLHRGFASKKLKRSVKLRHKYWVIRHPLQGALFELPDSFARDACHLTSRSQRHWWTSRPS
jgi:hypothetical protein